MNYASQLVDLMVQVMLPLSLLVCAGALWTRFFPDTDVEQMRSSLNRLVDLALYAHDDWFGVCTVDFAALEGETVGDFAGRWAGMLGGKADWLADVGVDPGAAMTDLNDDERKGLAAGAVAFAALTPQFLLR